MGVDGVPDLGCPLCRELCARHLGDRSEQIDEVSGGVPEQQCMVYSARRTRLRVASLQLAAKRLAHALRILSTWPSDELAVASNSVGARKSRPVLVVLSGLPGVGKTMLARRVSSAVSAVHVRLDTIEAALTTSGIVDRSGGWSAVPDAGYRIAYAVTADFLNAGHDVVADSVNPLAVTRQAWADTARAADALLIDVEVICSDREVHRNRVETRSPDIDGLTVPTWQQVEDRAYEPWSTRVLRVDTATGIDQAADVIVATFISSQATIVG